MLIDTLTQHITAAAGLGTAAFALVDSSKTLFGGTSNYGYFAIRTTARQFFPSTPKENRPAHSAPETLGFESLRSSLRANWLNGTPLEQQKAIAKAQIKLRLSEHTAKAYAQVTKVNADLLTAIAKKIASGDALDPKESNEWSRFDLTLTSILDECYARADQHYRNFSKATAVVLSVGLALLGQSIYPTSFDGYEAALLVGLAATPVAPIAKDLTSALSTAVKTAQSLRK
ncbi:hypothetical protein [Pseudomonas sp.]|uniref:hypothetical protein n=1 Tax=Pseudomonas sp. TaxID=306 RepID=UPI001B09429E|nr:hypothetical protein [Pseudomonas sp.]MBO9548074.1 hypothetical protein [Pseudomonas sp.]